MLYTADNFYKSLTKFVIPYKSLPVSINHIYWVEYVDITVIKHYNNFQSFHVPQFNHIKVVEIILNSLHSSIFLD